MIGDTCPQAARIQAEIFWPDDSVPAASSSAGDERIIRDVALAGLRSRRPELSEHELRRELMSIMDGFVPPP